ncbi:FadR/GntR family transcriptional regulator [Bacillus carboniphilus]
MKPATKVYIEIVEHLRDMIAKDGFGPGDRIPSERELSEKLGFGRSSVREALRALELLGLIETRRGEGTFLRDFQEHQLVELLGTFILQDFKVQNDALECKAMIEKSCLELIFMKDKIAVISPNLTNHSSYDEMMSEIVEVADNRLLSKIWKILAGYVTSYQLEQADQQRMKSFVHAFQKSDQDEIMKAFAEMHNLSK